MARIKICIEEDFVAQVSGSFSVNVLPGAPPPVPVQILPPTGQLPDEKEGVAVAGDKVATVSGGVAPYNYAFSGQPEGMTFSEKDNGDGTFDVLIAGTPIAGDAAKSPYVVTVTVTDSAPTQASATRKLSVV